MENGKRSPRQTTMTRHTLIRPFIVMVALVAVSGYVIQAHPPSAEANLAVTSVQAQSQTADAAIPSRCSTCHHSELLSRVVQLTTDSSPDLRPAWNPAGTRVAYYSGRSGNDDIWVVNADASEEARLTRDPASDRRPAWSPDGTKIAFDSDRAGTRDIWIMNADGSGQRQLTDLPGEEMFASWSPDGSQIVFFSYDAGRSDIWAIDVDGGDPRPLTENLADVDRGQCAFACHSPAFSPDGSKIVFHADEGGKRSIWLMDADGDNRTVLTSAKENSYAPHWTPDGRIIFMTEQAVAQTIRTDVRVIDPDGSNEITLFEEIAHGGPFIWSPDGTRVALHSQRGNAGNFDLFVATFGEPSEQEDVAPKAEEEAPAPEEKAVEEAVEKTAGSTEEASSTTVTPSVRLIGVVALVVGVIFVGVLVGIAAVVYGLRKSSR